MFAGPGPEKGEKGMLFRKDMDPCCAYCKKGEAISETEVICRKRGVVPIGGHCAAFRYDPMKRCPPRPVKLDTGNLKEEDFRL